MIRWVVDSSVAVKWFLPEHHCTEALCVLNSGLPLHAPTLLLLEVDSVFTANGQQGRLTAEEVDQFRSGLRRVPLATHDMIPLLDLAVTLALSTRQVVYDCLFLALALEIDGHLVTADRRFHRGIASTVHRTRVVWIGDVP